jgi:thiol-disulfide isomerase/thioredoxin
MAEAWAGQGMTEKAIALLKQGEADLGNSPSIKGAIDPEIARLELVGTAAASITAPHWLNAPAGTKELPMTGAVTLLEFSAHWCGPCRESYPGLNRLREKYGAQGFRVVIATQLYGYFGAERPLDAAAEIDRDTKYFAEHGLDVPVAIGDHARPAARNPDGIVTTHRDPNDDAYRVGGIPQIQIIDKHGVIRRLIVGYDNANEAKLAILIETLIAEK